MSWSYLGYSKEQLNEFILLAERLQICKHTIGFDLDEAVVDWRNRMTKPKLTREGAIKLFQFYIFADTNDYGRAKKWVDFFIAGGMLEVKEEEKKPREVIVLFETIQDIDGGTVRLETWPEGLVLWVNGEIKYKYWEDHWKDHNK